MEYITQKREAANIMQSAFGKRKRKKTPTSYKNTFWGMKDLISTDESSLCFFYHLAKKMRFLKKHFLKQIIPLLGFLSSEREGILSTYIHSARSCPQFAWKILWDKVCSYQVLDSLGKSNLKIIFMIWKQEIIKKHKIKFKIQTSMNKRVRKAKGFQRAWRIW